MFIQNTCSARCIDFIYRFRFSLFSTLANLFMFRGGNYCFEHFAQVLLHITLKTWKRLNIAGVESETREIQRRIFKNYFNCFIHVIFTHSLPFTLYPLWLLLLRRHLNHWRTKRKRRKYFPPVTTAASHEFTFWLTYFHSAVSDFHRRDIKANIYMELSMFYFVICCGAFVQCRLE